MNAKLDQVLEPSEPVLVTLQGLSGSGIAATDRRGTPLEAEDAASPSGMTS